MGSNFYLLKFLNVLSFFQSGLSQGETLFVVEVLLNCSNKSIKTANGETPQPCGPDEKGEMQVSFC